LDETGIWIKPQTSFKLKAASSAAAAKKQTCPRLQLREKRLNVNQEQICVVPYSSKGSICIMVEQK
jgi:hypothetical protein